MSGTKTETMQSESPKKGVQALFQDARIDAAHSLNGQNPDPISAAEKEPAFDSNTGSSIADSAKNAHILAAGEITQDDSASQQLQRQAEQLANYLRDRQKDLDHREAQLNAEIAQLESELRNARMCLSEREADQELRRQELDSREKEIVERLDRLAVADAALMRQAESETDLSGLSAHLSIENKRLAQQLAALKEERRQEEIQRQQAENALQYERQQLESRQEASLRLIRQRELQLEKHREILETAALKTSSKPDAVSPDLTVREEQIRRNAAALQHRQRELEEAENRLAQAYAETQKFHEQLTAERRELQDEIHRERQRLIVQKRQALAELEKKRQTLQRRGKHVDQCRAALLQLRSELQQMHRETLEIRLTTEELWIKLSSAAPPAALTHSLGRIRNRLADQYRLANAELIEKKTELESIRDQMVEQYGKFVEQKRQFEHWMECRHKESQQQASMLMAREQTLLQQQTRFEEQSEQWQVERMRYEQEIRLLRLKLTRQSDETANV
jgi:hypothetical protein